MDAETGERSETYDLEMQSESIGLGSKVAVVKEEDRYSGTLGRVMGISVSSSREIMCQVDFGDSNTRSFREKELILMPSLHGGFVTGLVSLWSKPEKNPMHCQQWNGACSYLGYRFCPRSCGLWLCTEHYREHERKCGNQTLRHE